MNIKRINLIVAIIYSVLMIMWLGMAINESDSDLMLGVIMLAIPISINWATYYHLKKQ